MGDVLLHERRMITMIYHRLDFGLEDAPNASWVPRQKQNDAKAVQRGVEELGTASTSAGSSNGDISQKLEMCLPKNSSIQGRPGKVGAEQVGQIRR